MRRLILLLALAAPACADPLQSIGEIEKNLKAIQNGVTQTQGSFHKVVGTLGKVEGLVHSFPDQVAATKAGLGLPQNPTLRQEAEAFTRSYLEKNGLDTRQAKALSGAVGNLETTARQFKIVDPTSILMMVGIAAGSNLVGQMASGGKMDLKSAVGFLGDKRFWGGAIGSSVAYSLAGMAITAVMPAGGGLIRALLPTMGAMAAGLFGWELGSKGFDKGFKQAMSEIQVPEIVGSAAGSTLGMFIGGPLLAGLGSFGGPIGAVAGAMLMGSLGKKLAGMVMSPFRKGNDEMAGPDPEADVPAEGEAMASQLGSDERYRATYERFVEAQKAGDQEGSRQIYSTLETEWKARAKSLEALPNSGHVGPGN